MTSCIQQPSLDIWDSDKNLLNGQTIKTKIVAEELQRQLGEDQVVCIDTHGKLKTLLRAPFQVISALKGSKNVLMFPAQNGLRVYAPLLAFFQNFFRERGLHYVVIGGWLPQFLSKRKLLTGTLKCFDGIYVETNTMKAALEANGFRNIFLMPNCKPLAVLSEDELVYLPARRTGFVRSPASAKKKASRTRFAPLLP